MNLRNRIEKLEKESTRQTFVFCWRKQGESDEQALARHLRENPEHGGPGVELCVIGWIDETNEPGGEK